MHCRPTFTPSGETMKKTSLALLLAALSATTSAMAQSHLTIYGVVDTGIARQTGKDTYMTPNYESSLGFMGTEDLGGGYKAMFQLEHRLNLNDGTVYGGNPDVDWYGGANVGIGTPFGTFRIGRVDELPTETLRTFDPFNQDSIASMTLSTQRSSQIDNTLRYDSPNLSGFQIGATYSLGKNTKGNDNSAFALAGADNDGYAGSVLYDNGVVALLGNWSRLADSNRSFVWNLGGAYTWGDLRISLAYEKTHDRGWYNAERSLSENSGVAESTLINGVASKMDNWILGLNYKVGPGTFKAAFNYVKVKDVHGMSAADGGAYWDSNSSADLKKYALGYTYDLSKRTSLYGMVAYTDYENGAISAFFNGSGYDEEHVTGIQLGMTHTF